MTKQLYQIIISSLFLTYLNLSHAEVGATLEAKSDSNVSGKINIVEQGQSLLITGQVQGLLPNQSHAFHIHEFGDCSANDASSAGKHFNPHDKPHGHPHKSQHHIGDLTNLNADENGYATINFVLEGVVLDTSEFGILNRSFVVHHQADDYESQPAGNAGKRIACGQIKLQ